MKKVLLVVALLLLATPLFAADVTITATKDGSLVGNLQKVNIGYTGAAEANSIRAFALSLTLDLTADANTNILNIRDFKRGESTTGNLGYGIFPAKFRTFIQVQNPTTADWADTNYTPLAEWGDVNAGWGNNTKWIVAELGTLYQGEANAPGTSGTLFAIDVNITPGTDCNLCIALDQIRGGVVKNDTTAATVTLPPGDAPTGTPAGCIKIVGAQTGVPCPNVIGMDRVAARAAIIGAGLTVGVEANVAPTAAGQAVRTINDQKPAPLTILAPSAVVDINAVSHPIKYMTALNSLYVNWVATGRPQCWAYPRQCHGDADGKKLGTLWVSGNDLVLLKAAISKNPPPAYCADFDHKKLGTLWVSGNDLAILKAYISKAEASVPMCGSIPTASKGFSADPNYWYFCVPTGAVCPPGQYCAPVAVCPNTP